MSERLVIVGASLAGTRAAGRALELGYDGEILLIGDESHLPYDRPPLSKAVLGGDDAVLPLLNGAEELSSHPRVRLVLGDMATGLDIEQRAVRTASGEDIPYDQVVLATGAAPNRLPFGMNTPGVHVLRTWRDAQAIRVALARGARTVIVGAGFIGAEVASAARKFDLPVTIIEQSEAPLTRAVGAEAGLALLRLHARYGTNVRLGATLVNIRGDDHVVSVMLGDGTELEADLVVVGIGASPNTGWLQSSGLTLDNGIVTDECLRASPRVWAAGDVCRWRSDRLGALLRLEHWTNAADQGAHVGESIALREARAYDGIPYFWSDWYGQRIQFAGMGIGTPIFIDGNYDSDRFVALYRNGDRLSGVLTLNRRSDNTRFQRMLLQGVSWDEALAAHAVIGPAIY
jgi:NADPH-dependent 2,4-dienoyl-CoA reductase/sulfur reductase-like enzyme